MFSLSEQKAKLANLNIRAEIHGEDFHTAVDLKFEMKVSNDVLSEFHPDLKSSLYKKADENSGQPELIEDPGHLPSLKFPLLAPIKWNYEGAGYAAVLHYGVSGKDNIVMIDTEIDSFKFDCQDGGTVAVSFRVIAHPDAVSVGRLSEMIQTEVSLSLEPPSMEEQIERELRKVD